MGESSFKLPLERAICESILSPEKAREFSFTAIILINTVAPSKGKFNGRGCVFVCWAVKHFNIRYEHLPVKIMMRMFSICSIWESVSQLNIYPHPSIEGFGGNCDFPGIPKVYAWCCRFWMPILNHDEFIRERTASSLESSEGLLKGPGWSRVEIPPHVIPTVTGSGHKPDVMADVRSRRETQRFIFIRIYIAPYRTLLTNKYFYIYSHRLM